MSQRFLWVDALRGVAIVLMVIFHFCYDLRYFGYVNWDVPNGPNWWPFRYVILSLFIFTVGLSLSLAHRPHFKRPNFIKRLRQLVLASVAITIMSFFLFPQAWIYFGILHFITIASLLGAMLVRFPRFALVIGLLILLGYWFGILRNDWPFHYLQAWLPTDTEDYVPLFPWLGVMYLGLGFASLIKTNKKKPFDIPKNKITNTLGLMGKHGLVIYLLHQPILFLCFYAVQFFA